MAALRLQGRFADLDGTHEIQGEAPALELSREEAKRLGNALLGTDETLTDEGIENDGGVTMLALAQFPISFNIAH
jgi:hypothetical protein